MPELLIELFCEEIPARMQADACLALRRLMDDKLKAAGFSPEGSESYVTPRRLVYTVPDLPSRQADVSEERKGPRVGAPQKALDGFLRATGLTQADLQVKDDPKGGFYVAKIERRGRPTGEVIGEALHQTVMTFPWPKSMRWGDGELRWVRPLHSVVCLFGGTIIDPHLEGVTSSDRTVGHRFLSPGAISVTGFDAYKQSLAKAYVLLDREARREAIKEASHRLAAEAGLTVVDDPGLLEEVCGLVEWPVVLLGGFEEAFLDVPEEVLMTSMRSHQKYFSCRSASTGALANRFVFISNIQTADNGAEIVKGNERVLRARLSDAQFFWDEDRKTPLEDRLVALKPMVFHARLGSVYDKAERMAVLARHLAPMLGGDERHAERAARLAKADLASDMVFEFPELQGVMGAYYARHGGEEADIAQAIGAHYSPAGPSDDVPTQPTAIAVALADKLDTLTGFWAIDETPTGSKDPYALRRAALGVIRIVLENSLRLDLTALLKVAGAGHSPDNTPAPRIVPEAETAALIGFFRDRLKVFLRDKGKRHDLIDAVFSGVGTSDLTVVMARLEALETFLASQDGAELLGLYRRAGSILVKERKKDDGVYDGPVDPSLLTDAAERALLTEVEAVRAKGDEAMGREDFSAAMAALAALRPPVDRFFEAVMVNDPDPALRGNRLCLLSTITSSIDQLADFSKIEG